MGPLNNPLQVFTMFHYKRICYFVVGISPSTSLVTDLKAIAGDDSRYMQYSSPSDMATQFNTIFQTISIRPTIVIEPITFGKPSNP